MPLLENCRARRNPPPPRARPTTVAAPLHRCPETASAASNVPNAAGSYIQMVPADALRWSLVSTRLGWWVSVPILLALGGKSLAAQSDQYEGKPIESVRFDPEKQPLSREQLLAMIP